MGTVPQLVPTMSETTPQAAPPSFRTMPISDEIMPQQVLQTAGGLGVTIVLAIATVRGMARMADPGATSTIQVVKAALA